ncbi:MAG: APC family permease [Bacteroidota bacterium]
MEEQNKQDGLHRSLGLKDATMMVAGSMIGSGIFIVSADMGRNVGGTGWLLLLWLISGIITVMAALSYGELAGMMPRAGGQFVYIQRAWGNLTGFLYGWSVFTVIQSGVIAAVAVGFAKFSGVFFPWIKVDNILFDLGFIKISSANIVAISLIILLTWVNSRGVKEGKLIQFVFTSAKLLALLFIIVSGIYIGLNKEYFAQNFSNMWESTQWLQNADKTWSLQAISGMGLILALGTAIIGSLFSSDAWNNVTFIAGEIKDPHRNIPKSLLYGTAIVTVIYMLANIAYLGLLPVHGDPNGSNVIQQGIQFASNDRVGTAAASQIFGAGALFFMAALIMVSTFGCNNGLILSGARVYYAMAKEGLFFKKAGTLNKNNVPAFALWIQAAWASILCLSGTYGDLLDYCTFASLIFYIVTIGGLFVLRKREPYAERPYKVIAYPILPILYIVIAVAICAILLVTKTHNTVSGLVIVGLGLPIYYIIKPKAEIK